MNIFVVGTLAQVEVGDKVCIEGYIMDRFCIDRGTLFDNPSVDTLEGPGEHSIHCLVDVPRCYNSGFEVLVDPLKGNKKHCRAFRLDDDGTDKTRELAQSLGSQRGCSTCTESIGSQNKGFRAKITGTVTEAGTSETPASLVVEKVEESSFGCEEGIKTKYPSTAATCVPEELSAEIVPTPVLPSSMPTPPTLAPVSDLEPSTTTGFVIPVEFDFVEELTAGLRIEYGLNVFPHKGDTISIRLTYEGTVGWLGFGVSQDGLMVGSMAIIGITGEGQPRKYKLGGYSENLVEPVDESNQTLINHSVETVDGRTMLSFTKLMKEDGEKEVVAGARNVFLWAMSDGTALGYHGFGNRGSFTLAIHSAEAPSPMELASPAPATTLPTHVPILTLQPTSGPTKLLFDPTQMPTHVPTKLPGLFSNSPSDRATSHRSMLPTGSNLSTSKSPSITSPASPSTHHTVTPNTSSTADPSWKPTSAPTTPPSPSPTVSPTRLALISLTNGPTMVPVNSPTYLPSSRPAKGPTLDPTALPTSSPSSSLKGSMPPTFEPTPILQPSDMGSTIPTNLPVSSTLPSNQLSDSIPTFSPTTSLLVGGFNSPDDSAGPSSCYSSALLPLFRLFGLLFVAHGTFV